MSNLKPKQRSAREQFDLQAGHYNADWNRWSETSLTWLLEHSRCSPQDRVLDVATGTGFTALAFAPHVQEVVGIDLSPGMLEQARARAASAGIANVTWEVGAAEALPYPTASFDIVTCRVAPHHFLSIETFAAEAWRVLRPSGRLLIADTSVPDDSPEAGDWQNHVEFLRDSSHIRNYSPGEWRKVLMNPGFLIEEIARCDEAQSMNVLDWMEKSGCTGEAAVEVRSLFATAPASARREFSIEPMPDGNAHLNLPDGHVRFNLPDGNVRFKWMRVVIAARKPV
ncbi:MAG: methyltransferase domain-containing protein [Acidobacteriota bacterium]